MDRGPSENRYRGCPGERMAVTRPGQHAQTAAGLAGDTGYAGRRLGGACAASGDLPKPNPTHDTEPGADTDHACDELERVEITREELIRRIRILRESGVISSESVSRLHVRLIESCPLRLFAIERALEEIHDVDIDCDRLARACRIMAPELYGDRPAPKKTSDAAPHSHARLECLARRWQSGSALWHAYDRHSSSRIQQKELFGVGDLYSSKPVKLVVKPLRLGRPWPNREQRELEYEHWSAADTATSATEADDHDD